MKRFILTLIAFVSILLGYAQLNNDQLQLRRNITSALSAAGYKPDIDGDNVFFTVDGTKYRVAISEKWSSPYLVVIYSEYPYNSDNAITKENVEGCISVVNQMKTIKLVCDKADYVLRSEFFCKDANVFDRTYKTIIAEQKKAHEDIVETIAAGLGGVDFTGSKSDLFAKALDLWAKKDYYKSFKLFKFLADNGYTLSYSMLGMAYENGLGVDKDEDLMIQSYEKAIDNGNSESAYKLGSYFYNKKEYDKAMTYLMQCTSSENIIRSAAYSLMGRMYENGEGVAKSLPMAIKNYRKAVEYSVELESAGRLALIRLGEQVENPKDFVDISKAMLSGLSAEEMYNKGKEYENGLNNRSLSLPKAYGYYKAAADKNHVKANLKMGEICRSKFYPFNDIAKSDKYYAKAFKLLKQQEGYSSEASYFLGMIYNYGLGVPKDRDAAIQYLMSASEKGIGDASYELGLIYKEELEGVEAFKFFLKAAEKGHPAAMLEVAKAYETGVGTPRNREQAINWYTKCHKTNSSFSQDAALALKRMGGVDDERE